MFNECNTIVLHKIYCNKNSWTCSFNGVILSHIWRKKYSLDNRRLRLAPMVLVCCANTPLVSVRCAYLNPGLSNERSILAP